MARMRVAGVLAAAALLAGSGCGDDSDEPTSAGSTSTTTASPTAGTKAKPDGNDGAVDLYFTAGEQFDKVETEAGGIREATDALLNGPPQGKAETQIPAGTKLEDVTVSDDGIAVVEVSPEFLQGVSPKAATRSDEQDAELNARLGQVTYTLTQFDQVEEAKVVAGGVAVEAPLERDDYDRPNQGPERERHPAAAAKVAEAKGLSTRRLQERLAELGYLPRKAVDGVAGYRTQQAVVAFQSWEGLDRDGVVGPLTTAALKTAKRPKPRAGGPSRRIEVYRDKGVALLVGHGRTRRAIHVSTGAGANATPAGTFRVFRKELRSWSVPFQVWLPYASYFNQGIAFHEYPDVPPYPASHGCVRVPAPEAPGVYKFAKIDTVVVVV